MRTAFFVDGYNLFYGLLADTRFKWLDLPRLLLHIVQIEEPASRLASVDYFTSSVKVHLGRHQLEPAKAPRFVDKSTHASRQDTVDIWKLEEKETDVNLAVSMYRMASKQACRPAGERIEQLVLVSGDTDMTPALRAIREDFPQLTLGVILPYRPEYQRPPPGSLKALAHWMRRVITAEELQGHQFPHRVMTHKAPAIKPDYW